MKNGINFEERIRRKTSTKRGHQKLSIEDLLLATLAYPRKYRTYAHISASYDIAESNIYRGIRWVEDKLIKDGTFSLPGQKALLKGEAEYEVILFDATKTPIERPKNKGDLLRKEKRHSLKTQMVINPESEEIIPLAFEKGKVHDFQLY